MRRILKEIIKFCIPYGVLTLAKKRRKDRLEKKYGWTGNFSSWDEAKKHTGGYDSDVIFEKVKSSLLKVKNGEEVYERDGVLFDKIEYSWPLLTGIMMSAAANKNGKINVLDFGGALGSSYFQNRKFLAELVDCKWFIAEQDKFISIGKEIFENEKLKFVGDPFTIKEEIDLIVLSSVLQYLEDPFEILNKLMDLNPEFFIIDLTGFVDHSKDIICIQNVSPDIYRASYPCRLFNEPDFLAKIEAMGGYRLVEEFDCVLGSQMSVDGISCRYKGMIFRKKKES